MLVPEPDQYSTVFSILDPKIPGDPFLEVGIYESSQSLFIDRKNEVLIEELRYSKEYRYPVQLYLKGDQILEVEIPEGEQARLIKIAKLVYGEQQAQWLDFDKSFESNLLKVNRITRQIERSNKQNLSFTIPESEADVLRQKILATKCVQGISCRASTPCIPFENKTNGCDARAHYMTFLINQAGFGCRKYRASGILRSKSPSQCRDQPPCYKWSYHIAPLLSVVYSPTDIRNLILDPSLADDFLTIPEWLDLLKVNCNNNRGQADIDLHLDLPGTYYNGVTYDPTYKESIKRMRGFCYKCKWT